MAPKDDDELTDITQLPDFNDDDDEFKSLEEMASETGITFPEDESPPDFPTPPDFDSTMEFSTSDLSEAEDEDHQSDDFETSSDFEEGEDFNNEENLDFSDDSSDEFTSSEENEYTTNDNDDEPFTENLDFSDVNNESNNFDSFEEEIDPDQETEEINLSSEKPESIERVYERIEAKRYSEDLTQTATLTSLSELKDSPEEKHQAIKTLIEAEERTHITPPEEFQDFKKFAKAMTFDDFSSEGNPPFSIIVKNLKYKEDAQDIIDILVQHKIIDLENKENALASIIRGQFLIPRLSEYAAIIICHKLRAFDCEILMGLTEEISPPKNYNSEDRGLTSRRSLLANQGHNFKLNKVPMTEDILTSTLDKLNNFQIVKYLGLASESQNIDYNLFHKSAHLEQEMLNTISSDEQSELEQTMIRSENRHASQSQNQFNYQDFYLNENNIKTDHDINLNQIYKELVKKLKAQARNAQANAVIGINFNITPLQLKDYLPTSPQYQITCTGNMVWIEKN